jgi:putative heme-binding domain-containing protein
LPDISQLSAYWLSFRQSNDWYNLLDWSKIGINIGYERKLAEMKIKQQFILDEHLPVNTRKSHVYQMTADSIGGQLLMGLAADNKLPDNLKPFVEEKIFQNPNAAVRVQASKYFKRPGTDSAYSIPRISKLTPDPARGKMVFASHCATCHKIGSEGSAIGPDLSSVGGKFGKTELLDAIINPSAAIVFGYEPWLVNTKDGESIYGFLVSENKQSIVIKDISGQKHAIQIKKITSRQRQSQSLMPDPVNNGLTEQNLADIAGYLDKNTSRSGNH